VEQSEKPSRDLAAIVVPQVGQLVDSGDAYDPYRLVDGEGAVVEAVAEYFRDLQAAGRSTATLRPMAWIWCAGSGSCGLAVSSGGGRRGSRLGTFAVGW
jgi:hypothetical protein